MPHWEGCSARGPDTLRVFSNWEVMRVIMPTALMNDRRESTCAQGRQGGAGAHDLLIRHPCILNLMHEGATAAILLP